MTFEFRAFAFHRSGKPVQEFTVHGKSVNDIHFETEVDQGNSPADLVSVESQRDGNLEASKVPTVIFAVQCFQGGSCILTAAEHDYSAEWTNSNGGKVCVWDAYFSVWSGTEFGKAGEFNLGSAWE